MHLLDTTKCITHNNIQTQNKHKIARRSTRSNNLPNGPQTRYPLHDLQSKVSAFGPYSRSEPRKAATPAPAQIVDAGYLW